jgi:hypothetical protein
MRGNQEAHYTRNYGIIFAVQAIRVEQVHQYDGCETRERRIET